MNMTSKMRYIAIVAVLGIQFLHPAPAASHLEAPMLSLEDVVFEGSGPVFDAGGNLVAVDRVRFSGVTADGHWVEGNGELSLLEPNQDSAHHAATAIIDGILGRVGHTNDSSSDNFTGQAQVDFDSVGVDQQRFEASGSMRLQLEILQPALVREFEIEADVVQDSDGGWSARFSGADRLGLGVHIEGFYVPSNEWGVWDDAEVVHLQGDVEAVSWLESGADSLAFEDKIGAEEMYYVYDDWGRLSDIEPSTEVEGRFSARLTLRLTEHGGRLNIQVGDVIVSESERTPDGKVSGRAEVFFSGVGEHDGVAITVNGTAEFNFIGDTVDSQDWFIASGELRILNATLEDAATGGSVLFEDISGNQGQARIVGTIEPSGLVDLTGALGQVTQVGLGKTVKQSAMTVTVNLFPNQVNCQHKPDVADFS